jgi:hypothetical protein
MPRKLRNCLSYYKTSEYKILNKTQSNKIFFNNFFLITINYYMQNLKFLLDFINKKITHPNSKFQMKHSQ